MLRLELSPNSEESVEESRIRCTLPHLHCQKQPIKGETLFLSVLHMCSKRVKPGSTEFNEDSSASCMKSAKIIIEATFHPHKVV